MVINFSDAQEQREFGLIPDGTFVKLKLNIRPGNVTIQGMDAADNGIFTNSRTSDVQYLDCEFKVISGRHRGAGIYRALSVAGGAVDEKGVSKGWNVTKSQIRAILESAQNVDPKDVTPAAAAKRSIPNFRSLDGIEFAARTGIEQGTDGYADKTVLSHVVVPGEDEYTLVMQERGDECTPKPTGTRRASGASTRPAATPSWNGANTPPARPAAPAAAWTNPAPQTTPAPAAPGPSAGLPSWVNNKG